VIDWPSRPRTIHRVGTVRASPVLWTARRDQIRVIPITGGHQAEAEHGVAAQAGQGRPPGGGVRQRAGAGGGGGHGRLDTHQPPAKGTVGPDHVAGEGQVRDRRGGDPPGIVLGEPTPALISKRGMTHRCP
jgi:hypothetical protein